MRVEQMVQAGQALWIEPDGLGGGGTPLFVEATHDELVVVRSDAGAIPLVTPVAVVIPKASGATTYRAEVLAIDGPHILLKLEDPMEAVQQRAWFRVDADFGIRASFGDDEMVEGFTLDVSATGMRFLVADGDTYSEDSPITIELELPSGLLCADATAVRSKASGDTVETAVRFVSLDEADRYRLIGAILARQRELYTAAS